jgi:hypothetical protein
VGRPSWCLVLERLDALGDGIIVILEIVRPLSFSHGHHRVVWCAESVFHVICRGRQEGLVCVRILHLLLLVVRVELEIMVHI